MSGVVDLLNRWGAAFTALAELALWQATLVAIVVALIAFAMKRSSPAVRYWLWQLVAIKLLLLPLGSWSIGLAWLPALAVLPAAAIVGEIEPGQAEVDPGATFLSPAPPGAASATSPPASQTLLVQSQHKKLPVPVPFSSAPVSTRLSWQAWLLLGWMAVVALRIARLLLQRWRLQWLLQATSAGSVELVAIVNQVGHQLQMLHSPAISVTQLDCSPFACGILRPRVVVPASILGDLDTGQLKQVLAHELAHLKRRDLIWGWITELARLLYFFHPAMLWAARNVRLERELACDQIAMRLCHRSPAEYAETLVRVLSSAAVPNAFRTAAASLDGGEPWPRDMEHDR